MAKCVNETPIVDFLSMVDHLCTSDDGSWSATECTNAIKRLYEMRHDAVISVLLEAWKFEQMAQRPFLDWIAKLSPTIFDQVLARKAKGKPSMMPEQSWFDLAAKTPDYCILKDGTFHFYEFTVRANIHAATEEKMIKYRPLIDSLRRCLNPLKISVELHVVSLKPDFSNYQKYDIPHKAKERLNILAVGMENALKACTKDLPKKEALQPVLSYYKLLISEPRPYKHPPRASNSKWKTKVYEAAQREENIKHEVKFMYSALKRRQARQNTKPLFNKRSDLDPVVTNVNLDDVSTLIEGAARSRKQKYADKKVPSATIMFPYTRPTASKDRAHLSPEETVQIPHSHPIFKDVMEQTGSLTSFQKAAMKLSDNDFFELKKTDPAQLGNLKAPEGFTVNLSDESKQWLQNSNKDKGRKKRGKKEDLRQWNGMRRAQEDVDDFFGSKKKHVYRYRQIQLDLPQEKSRMIGCYADQKPEYSDIPHLTEAEKAIWTATRNNIGPSSDFLSSLNLMKMGSEHGKIAQWLIANSGDKRSNFWSRYFGEGFMLIKLPGPSIMKSGSLVSFKSAIIRDSGGYMDSSSVARSETQFSLVKHTDWLYTKTFTVKASELQELAEAHTKAKAVALYLVSLDPTPGSTNEKLKSAFTLLYSICARPSKRLSAILDNTRYLYSQMRSSYSGYKEMFKKFTDPAKTAIECVVLSRCEKLLSKLAESELEQDEDGGLKGKFYCICTNRYSSDPQVALEELVGAFFCVPRGKHGTQEGLHIYEETMEWANKFEEAVKEFGEDQMIGGFSGVVPTRQGFNKKAMQELGKIINEEILSKRENIRSQFYNSKLFSPYYAQQRNYSTKSMLNMKTDVEPGLSKRCYFVALDKLQSGDSRSCVDMTEALDGPGHAKLCRKYQRTAADRGIFIPSQQDRVRGWICETISAIVAQQIPEEAISDPGDEKGNKMQQMMFATRDWKNRYFLANDMTKWSPGDNCYKFAPFFRSMLEGVLEPEDVEMIAQCAVEQGEWFLCQSGLIKKWQEVYLHDKKPLTTKVKDFYSQFTKQPGSNEYTKFVRGNWKQGMLNYSSSLVGVAVMKRAFRNLQDNRVIKEHRFMQHSDDFCGVVSLSSTGTVSQVYEEMQAVASSAAIALSERKCYCSPAITEFCGFTMFGNNLTCNPVKDIIAMFSERPGSGFFGDISAAISTAGSALRKGAQLSVVISILYDTIKQIRQNYSMGLRGINSVSRYLMNPDKVFCCLGGPVESLIIRCLFMPMKTCVRWLDTKIYNQLWADDSNIEERNLCAKLIKDFKNNTVQDQYSNRWLDLNWSLFKPQQIEEYTPLKISGLKLIERKEAYNFILPMKDSAETAAVLASRLSNGTLRNALVAQNPLALRSKLFCAARGSVIETYTEMDAIRSAEYIAEQMLIVEQKLINGEALTEKQFWVQKVAKKSAAGEPVEGLFRKSVRVSIQQYFEEGSSTQCFDKVELPDAKLKHEINPDTLLQSLRISRYTSPSQSDPHKGASYILKKVGRAIELPPTTNNISHVAAFMVSRTQEERDDVAYHCKERYQNIMDDVVILSNMLATDDIKLQDLLSLCRYYQGNQPRLYALIQSDVESGPLDFMIYKMETAGYNLGLKVARTNSTDALLQSFGQKQTTVEASILPCAMVLARAAIVEPRFEDVFLIENVKPEEYVLKSALSSDPIMRKMQVGIKALLGDLRPLYKEISFDKPRILWIRTLEESFGLGTECEVVCGHCKAHLRTNTEGYNISLSPGNEVELSRTMETIKDILRAEGKKLKLENRKGWGISPCPTGWIKRSSAGVMRNNVVANLTLLPETVTDQVYNPISCDIVKGRLVVRTSSDVEERLWSMMRPIRCPSLQPSITCLNPNKILGVDWSEAIKTNYLITLLNQERNIFPVNPQSAQKMIGKVPITDLEIINEAIRRHGQPEQEVVEIDCMELFNEVEDFDFDEDPFMEEEDPESSFNYQFVDYIKRGAALCRSKKVSDLAYYIAGETLLRCEKKLSSYSETQLAMIANNFCCLKPQSNYSKEALTKRARSYASCQANFWVDILEQDFEETEELDLTVLVLGDQASNTEPITGLTFR
ncbi:L protein [Wenling hagfish virus]|uniref:RNA-directed RNA polymerase L n=1 Tax=Wenling hagfish virus TaxID=2116438 RepID=A0A2P1GNT0_9VIRU|nr:L protein [Wenling hagfish virus]AVM87665.1 L protein [Wenling hagfish virus]